LKEVAQFFEFVNEREATRIRKESGAPAPWTEDPILQKYRFCNIFREDDKTTRWFRDNVRGPLKDSPSVALMTIAFRWFNRIEVGELLTPMMMTGEWDRDWAEKTLRPHVEAGGKTCTGAYMIRTPQGKDKLTGVLELIEGARGTAEALVRYRDAPGPKTLEEAHSLVCETWFLGPFLAYEVITDLRHTYLLRDATDISTWASPGPGAARGTSWLHYGRRDKVGYGSVKGKELSMHTMRNLVLLANTGGHWNYPHRSWEMREAEHCLCEYDKMRRAQGGQRLKRKYTQS
jgi:hypothetical protein